MIPVNPFHFSNRPVRVSIYPSYSKLPPGGLCNLDADFSKLVPDACMQSLCGKQIQWLTTIREWISLHGEPARVNTWFLSLWDGFVSIQCSSRLSNSIQFWCIIYSIQFLLLSCHLFHCNLHSIYSFISDYPTRVICAKY